MSIRACGGGGVGILVSVCVVYTLTQGTFGRLVRLDGWGYLGFTINTDLTKVNKNVPQNCMFHK